MNPRTTFSTIRESATDPWPSAMVVAMPRPASRRARRKTAVDDAPRGQILLFTGVRYERMAEALPEPMLSQRKRS